MKSWSRLVYDWHWVLSRLTGKTFLKNTWSVSYFNSLNLLSILDMRSYQSNICAFIWYRIRRIRFSKMCIQYTPSGCLQLDRLSSVCALACCIDELWLTSRFVTLTRTNHKRWSNFRSLALNFFFLCWVPVFVWMSLVFYIRWAMCRLCISALAPIVKSHFMMSCQFHCDSDLFCDIALC